MQIAVVKADNLCNGDSKGKFKLTVTGGTGPYLYSFNGSAYATVDSFTNLIANTYNYAVKDANNCVKSGTVSITQPSKIGLSTLIDSVKCFKQSTGQISINASGGTTPYQYAINSGVYGATNVFTGLIAGAYYVQIRDNNLCVKDTTVIISQPFPLGDGLVHKRLAGTVGP